MDRDETRANSNGCNLQTDSKCHFQTELYFQFFWKHDVIVSGIRKMSTMKEIP